MASRRARRRRRCAWPPRPLAVAGGAGHRPHAAHISRPRPTKARRPWPIQPRKSEAASFPWRPARKRRSSQRLARQPEVQRSRLSIPLALNTPRFVPLTTCERDRFGTCLQPGVQSSYAPLIGRSCKRLNRASRTGRLFSRPEDTRRGTKNLGGVAGPCGTAHTRGAQRAKTQGRPRVAANIRSGTTESTWIRGTSRLSHRDLRARPP